MPQRRLLVITQVMDDAHPVLGFFASWVRKWKQAFPELRVLALQVDPSLSIDGVSISSLGKESGTSLWTRFFRLWKTVWTHRRSYDAVFVHMNEEYVVVCGAFWRLLGKRVILWRNHPTGTWKTPIAALFADELMYTSPQSYVAKYAHARQMPAGIPWSAMYDYTIKQPGLIVMAGRIAEWYKRTHLLVEAGLALASEYSDDALPWSIEIVGDPDKGEEMYYDRLKERVRTVGQNERVRFSSGKPYGEILDLYAKADMVVNTTQSGSFDKALLEAISKGCIPITSNAALRHVLPDYCYVQEDSAEAIVTSLRYFLRASQEEKNRVRDEGRKYISATQSFEALTQELVTRVNL